LPGGLRSRFPQVQTVINGVPRILIIRLSAIGDVVRVLPALHALRDLHPTGQIDWAVERKAAAVLEDHIALDQVLVFERKESERRAAIGEFWRFLRKIRAERYDIVVDFHGIFKSGLIAALSGARERIGFARPRAQELSWLFTNRRVKLVSQYMNRIEENLELCKALGAKRHHLDVELDVPEEVQDEVDDYITERFQGAKLLVALHVPVDRPEKQWPLTYYAELADLLLSDGRFEVVLTWGPGQRAIAQAVQDLTDRNAEVAPEMPTLKHYLGLMEHCALYVGGDTGPMHLASALGVPVVAIFGGTSPQQHAPLRRPSRVLFAGEPLDLKVRPKEAEGLLRAITPEMAYDACIQVTFGDEHRSVDPVPRGTLESSASGVSPETS